MKILISVQYFEPPFGGAERSLITLAKKMSEKHDVYVIQPGKMNDTRTVGSIKILEQEVPFQYKLLWHDLLSSPKWKYHISPIIFQAKYWRKVLEKNIIAIKPDLILTQLNFAPPSIDVAVKYNIPSIMFIRSCDQFCPIGFINGTDCDKKCHNCISLQNKIRFLYIDKWLKWNYKIIGDSGIVVANSHFIANLTKKLCNVNPIIMYPSINLIKYDLQNNSKEFITLVNPTKGKGIDIFLKIAKSLPQKKFIVVGRSTKFIDQKIIQDLNNVTFLEWTDKIEEVYSKTKILLSPAIWPEAFGRTIIEAGINGIPSIGSNCGGVPEAIGNGGIIINNVYDVEEWVDAIYSLDDSILYDQLSKNAKMNAEKFNFESSYREFKKDVSRLIGIHL